MAGSSAIQQLKTILVRSGEAGFFSAAVLVSRLLENSQEDIHHHLAASRQVAQTSRRKLPTSISSNQWRWRWNAFETPGLEPVFPKTDEAIAYLRFLWIEVSFLVFSFLPFPSGNFGWRCKNFRGACCASTNGRKTAAPRRPETFPGTSAAPDSLPLVADLKSTRQITNRRRRCLA